MTIFAIFDHFGQIRKFKKSQKSQKKIFYKTLEKVVIRPEK